MTIDSSVHSLIIDAGGTKIRGVLFDPHGRAKDDLIRHESGYVRKDVGPVAEAIALITQQFCTRNSLSQDQIQLVAGIAGINHDATGEAVGRAIMESVALHGIRVVNDADLIGRASPTPATIVTICGTGSSVVGYVSQRPVCKSSGVNELLSDQGSAYWMGHKMLRATTKALDGRQPHSALSRSVCDFFGIDNAADLQAALEARTDTKRHIASVSTLLTHELMQNDPAAKAIADKAVDELAEAILAVRAQLAVHTDVPPHVRFTGGVFNNNAYIFDTLSNYLRSQGGMVLDAGVTDAVAAGLALAAKTLPQYRMK